MAQFEDSTERDRQKIIRPRSPAHMHSASPRLHGMGGPLSPKLPPIAEPRHDLAHLLARRTLHEHKRYRKARIRVDAFLGEWLNPQYFDHITPPPPSPMMVAGAKAELMQNEAIDLFTPTVTQKSSNNSLWSANHSRSHPSRESTLDDWSHVTDALHAPSPRRDRSTSVSSIGSNDSANSSGRRSPFRPGHVMQPLASTIPKPEFSVYHPPTPSYAVSSSDHIPKGYVSHARNATVNVDYHWDSSRAPLDWGDGGEYGEEWSSMHKRFRKGLNNMVEWYSRHNADDRGEDALGIDQADRPHFHYPDHDEEEDLVVILVTHGAGSNALIGALTSQPVLLDVGMASLTMAVRKDNAPAVFPQLDTASPTPDGTSNHPTEPESQNRRRSSLDIGLHAFYEMKLVSSSEHLRPGIDPTKLSTTHLPNNLRNAKEALGRYKAFGSDSHAGAGAGIDANWDLGEARKETAKSNTSTALGSIRRPSAPNMTRIHTDPSERISSPVSPGLWTPPSGRGTPLLWAPKERDDKSSDGSGRDSPGADAIRESANPRSPTGVDGSAEHAETVDIVLGESHEAADAVGDLPKVGKEAPSALSRSLSVKGLWGAKPSGDEVIRTWKPEPKRRWTVSQND
jgi:hypothetical protein